MEMRFEAEEIGAAVNFLQVGGQLARLPGTMCGNDYRGLEQSAFCARFNAYMRLTPCGAIAVARQG